MTVSCFVVVTLSGFYSGFQVSTLSSTFSNNDWLIYLLLEKHDEWLRLRLNFILKLNNNLQSNIMLSDMRGKYRLLVEVYSFFFFFFYIKEIYSTFSRDHYFKFKCFSFCNGFLRDLKKSNLNHSGVTIVDDIVD